MNLCAIQQKTFSAMEEMKRFASLPSSDRRDDDVLCPKPRRFHLLNPRINEHPSKPFRRNFGLHTESELCGSETGIDLQDILLLIGGCPGEQSVTPLDSSPHFTCGSPPSRVPNPLTQDDRFGDEKVASISPLLPSIHLISGQSMTASPASYILPNFRNNPAVRVEGFDCLKRERGNCSILTFA